jgi:hypothetical protein
LVVVQVGCGLGEREVILSAVDGEMGLKQNSHEEGRLDNVRMLEGVGKNLSHAFNLAASFARGRYLLFFLETMEVPSPSGYTFPAQKDNVMDYLISVVGDTEGSKHARCCASRCLLFTHTSLFQPI